MLAGLNYLVLIFLRMTFFEFLTQNDFEIQSLNELERTFLEIGFREFFYDVIIGQSPIITGQTLIAENPKILMSSNF